MMRRRLALAILMRALHRESGSYVPWDAAPTPAQWRAAIRVASEMMMAPALYSSLEKTGQLREMPREVRNQLARLYRTNRRRNSAIRQQLVELLGALNAEGIEPLLLGSAFPVATAPSIESAAHTVTVLDLVVPVGQDERAIETMRSLGYGLRRRPRDRDREFGEFMRDGDAITVGLRSELIDQMHVLPAEEVWRRARRHGLREGASCFAPGPTDRAFHHLLHAQIDCDGGFYRGRIDLRQLHEFDLLAEKAVDWIFIEDRLRRHRLLTPLYSYLLAAGALFGTRWPYDTPPPWQARAHVRGCLVALRHPLIRWAGAPLNDLRGALARPRMEPIYSSDVSEPFWSLHNLPRILRRDPARFTFHRTFRL